MIPAFTRFHSFLVNPCRGRKPRFIEKDVGDVQQIFKLIPVDGIQVFFINELNWLRKYFRDWCAEKITEPGRINVRLVNNAEFFLKYTSSQHTLLIKFW